MALNEHLDDAEPGAVCVASAWPCASACGSPSKSGDSVTVLELVRPATMAPYPVAGLTFHVPRGSVPTGLDGLEKYATVDLLELSDC